VKNIFSGEFLPFLYQEDGGSEKLSLYCRAESTWAGSDYQNLNTGEILCEFIAISIYEEFNDKITLVPWQAFPFL
jgi:hypothetical protein